MSQKELEVILMRELASCLAMPIILMGPNSTLLYFNEPAEVLLGKRFDEAGEMPYEQWSALFVPRDEDGSIIPQESLPLAVALRERRPVHRKFWITGLDGVSRRIEVTAFPLEGLHDRHLGAVAIFWGTDHT